MNTKLYTYKDWLNDDIFYKHIGKTFTSEDVFWIHHFGAIPDEEFKKIRIAQNQTFDMVVEINSICRIREYQHLINQIADPQVRESRYKLELKTVKTRLKKDRELLQEVKECCKDTVNITGKDYQRVLKSYRRFQSEKTYDAFHRINDTQMMHSDLKYYEFLKSEKQYIISTDIINQLHALNESEKYWPGEDMEQWKARFKPGKKKHKTLISPYNPDAFHYMVYLVCKTAKDNGKISNKYTQVAKPCFGYTKFKENVSAYNYKFLQKFFPEITAIFSKKSQ